MFGVMTAYVWAAFFVSRYASEQRWSIRKRLAYFIGLTIPTAILVYVLI